MTAFSALFLSMMPTSAVAAPPLKPPLPDPLVQSVMKPILTQLNDPPRDLDDLCALRPASIACGLHTA